MVYIELQRTLQNRAFIQIHPPRKHSGLTKIPGFAKPSYIYFQGLKSITGC